MGYTGLLFVYFISFFITMTSMAQNLTINGKIVYGVLGIRTVGSVDESTEQCPLQHYFIESSTQSNYHSSDYFL